MIQWSLLRAKVLEQQEVKKLVQDKMIVDKLCHKQYVSIYEPVCKSNAPTFATLYQVVKHTKDRDQKTVIKADINVLRRLINSQEAGRPVDLSSVLKHELLPVPISLAKMNDILRTGNKSELANVVTGDINPVYNMQFNRLGTVPIPVSRIEFTLKSSVYWPIIGLGTRTWSVAMRCSDPAGQSELFVHVLHLKTFNWMYCYREFMVGIVVSAIADFRLVDNMLSSSHHC